MKRNDCSWWWVVKVILKLKKNHVNLNFGGKNWRARDDIYEFMRH